jgi:hypothetical protein
MSGVPAETPTLPRHADRNAEKLASRRGGSVAAASSAAPSSAIQRYQHDHDYHDRNSGRDEPESRSRSLRQARHMGHRLCFESAV